MNIERIINMVIRQFVRRGVNATINKGSKMLSQRGGGEPVAPEQQQAADQTARQAKKAMRMARRLNRMR